MKKSILFKLLRTLRRINFLWILPWRIAVKYGLYKLFLAAREAGRKKVIVPIKNAAEASVVDGVEVYGVSTFRELYNHLLGRERIAPTTYHKESFYAQSRAEFQE